MSKPSKPESHVLGRPMSEFVERLRAMAPKLQETPAASGDGRRERIERARSAGVADPRALAIGSSLAAPIVEDHAANKQMFAMAQSFLDDDGVRTAVFSGPSGIGKSIMAAWVLAQRGGLLVQPPPVFDNEWNARVRQALKTGFVVVDDLGTEPQGMTGTFERLIEQRHDAGRKTLITTNLRPQEFARVYSARMIDRIDMTVTLGGQSLRRK